MWLDECPSFWDEGRVRPLVTESGEVVLMCDSCAAVWPTLADFKEMEHVEPNEPDWAVTAGVHVRPGTFRWASARDLEAAGMSGLEWRP
ncbi:MAG TPA: hypothetical protein VFG15_16440 [Amycolatopsis sp.]|nr:hypothetical protein [Amycolatopsis sp.]